MKPEILQMKGMLAEAKNKYGSLATEASGLAILIRSLLNPYEEIQKLHMDKLLVSVNRLKDITKEMQALNDKIKRLESELE